MSAADSTPALDMTKLHDFMGKAVADMGAAMHTVVALVGDRLGLYKAMADSQPGTSAELASRTGTHERYIREWLNANAASGYVTYDAAAQTYTLPPEQAFALAVENSPAYLPGSFQIISSLFHDAGKIEEAFRTGKGVGWHEHHHDLYHGTERFFRPGYIANLTGSWIPALSGVEEKLKAGAKVADIGCGLGASTILMARAYPKSRFFGFDYHQGSIDLARAAAAREGVSDRIDFEVAPAKAYPGTDYDLVAFFDCLHDMGDPAGAAAHVLSTLKQDGTWMIVEPFAEDATEANHNPVGRIFFSASTLVCVPASLAQEERPPWELRREQKRLREGSHQGGFGHFRRATQTPFNLVFEAKPCKCGREPRYSKPRFYGGSTRWWIAVLLRAEPAASSPEYAWLWKYRAGAAWGHPRAGLGIDLQRAAREFTDLFSELENRHFAWISRGSRGSARPTASGDTGRPLDR